MRTSSLATLIFWAAGSFISRVNAKQCAYGDDPRIIAHDGTPTGSEIVVNGCQCLCPHSPPP